MPEPRPILIADDEPEIRGIINEYLKLHGYAVVEASNGLEVLLQVKRTRPAAVILDLNMPRLSGLDALKRIRAFDPAIRVIVVTALADDVRDQALAMGAEAVLPKPLRLGELLAALGGERPAAPASAVAAPAPEPAPAPSAPGARGRILVVDDEPELCAILTEILETQGHTVRSASGASAATRAIALETPDIVLLDINMPGLTGVDALPVIRVMAPDTKVIMVSGTGDSELARKALAYGAFDYVVKPVDFAHLIQAIETALLMKESGG